MWTQFQETDCCLLNAETKTTQFAHFDKSVETLLGLLYIEGREKKHLQISKSKDCQTGEFGEEKMQSVSRKVIDKRPKQHTSFIFPVKYKKCSKPRL